MTFEHFALNLPDARSAGAWYAAQLGLRVIRAREDAPYTQFLADATGRVFLEIYSNPVDPAPRYADQHPLRFHFAFAPPDARAARARLVAAGATPVGEESLADGTVLIMLRDPWGVAIQLCQRAVPF